MISLKQLTAFFYDTPLLPILQYFLVMHVNWRDFLLFSVRNGKTSPYIHHEGKSCIEYELQPFLECQMAVALNLL